MRKSKWVLLSAALVAAVAGFVMLTGCEKEPSTDVSLGDYHATGHGDVFSDTAKGALVITPGTYTFTSASTNDATDIGGRKIYFVASGGVPPYSSWWVSTPHFGNFLTPADNANGIYTVAGVPSVGNNIISIEDSVGQVANATVTTRYKQ